MSSTRALHVKGQRSFTMSQDLVLACLRVRVSSATHNASSIDGVPPFGFNEYYSTFNAMSHTVHTNRKDVAEYSIQ